MRNKQFVGFTIVELIVVIAIIGILAGITVFSYSAWKQDTTVTQLKSDLKAAHSAMENARNFGSGYPTSVPSNFTASSGVTVTGGSSDGKTFCLSAVNSQYPSMYYYLSSDSPEPQEGQCVDTITIGSGGTAQVWMAKNLKIGRKLTSPDSPSPGNGVEMYCYDDLDANCDKYGGMYTWSEAMQDSTTEGARGACPAGFHVPTDGEWKTLESNLGMPAEDLDRMTWWVRGQEENVGTQLKEGGTSHFDAPMGGAYDGSFMFSENGSPNTGMAGYWTSTKDGNAPIERIFEGPATYVGRFTNGMNFGPYDYLRCIKNS